MICAILVLQITLFVFGIIMLVTGRIKLSASRVVTGASARLLGVLAMIPLPLCWGISIVYVVVVALQNPNVAHFEPGSGEELIVGLMHTLITLGTLAAVLGIGYAVGKAPVDKRQRLVDEWEDEEDDDRPRRRRAAPDDGVEVQAPRRSVSREDEEDRKRGRYRE
jgi:hypothetical protein